MDRRHAARRLPGRLPADLAHPPRLLRDAHHRGLPRLLGLRRGHHPRAIDRKTRPALLTRRGRLQSADDDLDLRPGGRLLRGRQEHRRHRRYGSPHPPPVARRTAPTGPLPRLLRHLPLHRNERRHRRCPRAHRPRTLRTARPARGVYRGRRHRRRLLRRQPLVHLRHHHRRHTHSGL